MRYLVLSAFCMTLAFALPLPGVAQDLAYDQPQPEPVATQARWAMDFHAGQYTLDTILDYALEKHPSVKGSSFGVALHYFGDKGPDRSLRHVISIDYAKADGSGMFQEEAGDKEEYGALDYSLISLTYTATWYIIPTQRFNPYVGIGFGVGMLEGDADGEDEKVSYSGSVPVFHIPVGINIKFSDSFWAHAEAGFRMGVYYSAGVTVLF